ncbi:MAG TPA: hypothetical protein PKK48_04065 [Phycisphaerae bacterium]|nr:hypothetical protein [Phycisphaerae bacterium]HPS53744.1 hypothetical protein [Phycisphaerae bacterium]
MTDVHPSPSAVTTATSSQSAVQTPGEHPQPIRNIERLSTDESQAIRKDPAILEMLDIFKGEIRDIFKDLPAKNATNQPATGTSQPIHSADTDDYDESE